MASPATIAELNRRRARLAARRDRAPAARQDAREPYEKSPALARVSSRPLEAYYRRIIRAWAVLMRRRILDALATWARDRRPMLRRRDSDDDGDPLDDNEAADLAYWLRRELSNDPIRLPAAPSPAALRAYAEQAARRAEAAARRHLVQAGASASKLGVKLGLTTDRIRQIDIAPSELHRQALEEWTRLNLDLVIRIPQEALVGYDAFIAEVVRGGIRWGSRNEPGGLQKQLMDRLGISERHATLIARDQIGKLQGQVTQATQQAAGVVSYVWRTVDDERVRGRPGGRYPKANPSHWALDGLTFQWDHPPVCGPGSQRGHPGHAILCRCFASPILPDDITD